MELVDTYKPQKDGIVKIFNDLNIPFPAQSEGSPESEISEVLLSLENQLPVVAERHGDDYFSNLAPSIPDFLIGLTFPLIVEVRQGLDYNLNLLLSRATLVDAGFSNIISYLVTLPKGRDGLVKENHGHGYHIHYVVIKNRREIRSDVLFTFNPKEEQISEPKLYWERHSGDISKEPGMFGERRKIAVYDTSCQFLNSVPINEFKVPGYSSDKFWP